MLFVTSRRLGFNLFSCCRSLNKYWHSFYLEGLKTAHVKSIASTPCWKMVHFPDTRSLRSALRKRLSHFSISAILSRFALVDRTADRRLTITQEKADFWIKWQIITVSIDILSIYRNLLTLLCRKASGKKQFELYFNAYVAPVIAPNRCAFI